MHMFTLLKPQQLYSTKESQSLEVKKQAAMIRLRLVGDPVLFSADLDVQAMADRAGLLQCFSDFLGDRVG